MKFIFAAALAATCIASGGPAFAQATKVGIEVCDTFLDKYEACTKDKVGPLRKQLVDLMTDFRTEWSKMAKDPDDKKLLQQVCTQAIESAKASLNGDPYYCGF